MEKDWENIKLGMIDSPTNPKDYRYNDLVDCTSDIEIQDEFILDYQYSIKNQGYVGSCVAHGIAGVKSYIDGVDYNNDYSVGWIYANRKEGDYEGSGMITREALKNLVDDGVCYTKSFPINMEYPTIRNYFNTYGGYDKLLKEANQHKSLAYIRLDKNEIKEYFCKYKKPIILSLHVYENFYESLRNKGKIPSMPKGRRKGGHTVFSVGYNKNDELIIINSWGKESGDNGRFYLDINSPIIKEIWVLEDVLNVRPKPRQGEWIKEKQIHPGGDIIKWKYLKPNDTYCNNEWLQLGKDWFYFKGIYALSNDWILWKGKWYYFDNNCYMKTNYWCLWKGKWYYLLEDGTMATNMWIDNYWVDDNGVWTKTR